MAHLNMSVIRTTKPDFEEIYGLMAQYFRAKTSAAIDSQYYAKVKHYPLSALKAAVHRLIDNNKPVPSNFPAPYELVNLCVGWLNDNPKEKDPLMIYDPNEDHEFPLRHLTKAFEILLGTGEKAFLSYCDAVRMPVQDRRRVHYKAVMVAGKEGDEKLKARLRSISETVGLPF